MKSNIPTTEMKTKAIRSRKIAFQLRKMGFSIIGTSPNRFKPEFDVYIFENTPELQKALDEVLG